MALVLPHEGLSVPIVRRVLVHALDVLGCDRECSHDIQVALTEAVTNVLEHTRDDEKYEVAVTVAGDLCTIEVIDTGHGFDTRRVGADTADAAAEQGRGLHLMRALVDGVHFESRPDAGTVVHLEKRLAWRPDAPARRLDTAPRSAPAG